VKGGFVLHVGLDLSRKRVDVSVVSDHGELLGQFPAPVDPDGLHSLVRRVGAYRQPVRGVIESTNGARFVHDQLVAHGWEVLLADTVKVKGLAPLACKTDKIDSRVLAELSFRGLVPAIWLPDPRLRSERERARFRLHLVKHRTGLNAEAIGTRSPANNPSLRQAPRNRWLPDSPRGKCAAGASPNQTWSSTYTRR
jgi:transposase